MIKKEKDKYVVYSKTTGKVLGRYTSRADALKQETKMMMDKEKMKKNMMMKEKDMKKSKMMTK